MEYRTTKIWKQK